MSNLVSVIGADGYKYPPVKVILEQFNLKGTPLIGPPFVLVLGQPALDGTLPFKLPIGKVRGRWYQWNDRWCMPTFDAYSIKHAPGNEAQIKRDVEKLARSVLLQDLALPTIDETCVICRNFGTIIIRKLAFCQKHQPKKNKGKLPWTQTQLEL